MGETTDPVEGPYVVSLSATDETTDRAHIGGKGTALARLLSAGLPVPEGFCVTTAAYRRLIEDESIERMIDDLSTLDPTDTDAIEQRGAAIRAAIREQELPVAARQAITTALETEDTDRYAVRSSATAEDRPSASFAGQQETYLNVPPERVIERVRACMASLFTDRAIAYRAKNDVSHTESAIAVVVQRMVTPDVSGVLFTADPTTGNRHTAVIEATPGLGSALVSGDVAGDTVLVDRKTSEIEAYEVNEQQLVVRPRPEGDTETVEPPPDARDSRVLTDEQIRSLIEIGAEIEALFDRPQDIEWCLTDGEIAVVQARPITSLFPVPTPKPADDRLHVYMSMGHGQAFAEALPPLVRDLWMEYVQTAFSAFGVGSGWGAEAGGRIYLDITPFLRVGPLQGRIARMMSSVSGSIGAALDDLLARRGEDLRENWTAYEALTALPGIVHTVWTGAKNSRPLIRSMVGGFAGAFIGAPASPEQEEEKWTAWGERIAAKMRAPDSIRGRTHAAFDVGRHLTDFPSIGPLYAAFAVDAWLWRWAEKDQSVAEDVTAVGRGFPKELVTRINLGLGDLADVAREHPEVADALRAGESLEAIRSCAGGEAFVTAVDEYLEEFGHRATGEMDSSRPRWREDPSGLLATVRANLEQGEVGEHREHLRQMEREADVAAKRLESRAGRGVVGPIRKRVVHQLLRTYRGYIRAREYPKHGVARMFAAWHDVFTDAGEQLAHNGRLERADDVWFLRKDELLGALNGEETAVDIDARRAELERYKGMDAPPVLTSEGEAPSAQIQRGGAPDGALVGSGVSGGVVEGTARVVHDPTEETIESGEILIAPSADPGWTPLFLNAAGMVVEVGGRMSHGALVAREYGLPAVVSVPEATQRIDTGQRVRVDGTNGTVEIIE